MEFWFYLGLGNFIGPFPKPLKVLLPKPDQSGNPDGGSTNTLVKAFNDTAVSGVNSFSQYKAYGTVEIQQVAGTNGLNQGPIIWKMEANTATLDIGSFSSKGEFTPLTITSPTGPIGLGQRLFISGCYYRDSTADLPPF